MDEADILGDRIAMIANGKLIADATSYYLKNKFGRGYYLTLSKKRYTNEGTEKHNSTEYSGVKTSSTDISLQNSINDNYLVNIEDEFHKVEDHLLKTTVIDKPTNEFIKSRIENAILIKNNVSEMVYSISNKPEYTKKYSKVFKELEKRKHSFNIESIGLSDTTLEEVFIRLAKEPESNKNYYKSNWCFLRFSLFHLAFWKQFFSGIPLFKSKNKKNVINEEDLFQYTKKRVDNKFKLLVQQLYGLMIKRFHRVKRNYRGFIAEIILPIFFVCLALLVASLAPKISNQPALEIHPWLTLDSTTDANYIFYRQYLNEQKDENDINIIKNITNTFFDTPSIGTRCMKNHSIKFPGKVELLSCENYGYTIQNRTVPTDIKNALSSVNYSYTNIAPSCSCTTGYQNCPIGSSGDIEYKNVSHLITKDTLNDLTDRNISDWLLNTEFSQEYFQKRYGGFDFSNNPSDADIVSEIYKIFESLTNPVRSQSKKQIVKIWYNNKGYFSPVAFLNTLNNAILRSKLKNQNVDSANVGLISINHPLPYTVKQINDQLTSNRNIGNQVFVSICIIFALSFIPASFLIFTVDERSSNSKQLQFVSGIKPYIYWTANFIWDMLNYAFPCFICVILFLIFDVKLYTSEENFSALVCLMLMFGWASKVLF
jgi:ATP-binding cassette subfamily A (ABC1) protein 1